MSSAVVGMQQAIRQQSEDLREELAELAKWEDSVKSKGRKELNESELPPIRGTAPLAKPTKIPQEDPIATAKEQGNEYFKRCQFDDAVRMYSKGITLDPTSSTTHVLYANRAMCYLKLQQWEDAEKDATTCIQMNRTYFKAFYRRALARRALGKLEEARSDLETVLVLSPGDGEAQRELKAVTEALKSRKQVEPTSKSRKKLVIEEVEDDSDEETDMAKAKAQAAERRKADEARERLAEQEARAAAAEKEKRRKEHEMMAEEAKRRVRSNPRIEELDDESPATSPAKDAKPSKAPLPRKVEAKWDLDKVPAPQSFTEFEKMYNELHGDIAQLSQYVQKIDTSKLPRLMGSSLSSEILVSLFEVARNIGEPFSSSLIDGLSQVRRLDEVVLFLEPQERQLVDDVLSKSSLTPAAKQKFA